MYIKVTICPAFLRNCLLVAKSIINNIIKTRVAKNTTQVYIKNIGGMKAIKKLAKNSTHICRRFIMPFIIFSFILKPQKFFLSVV